MTESVAEDFGHDGDNGKKVIYVSYNDFDHSMNQEYVNHDKFEEPVSKRISMNTSIADENVDKKTSSKNFNNFLEALHKINPPNVYTESETRKDEFHSINSS